MRLKKKILLVTGGVLVVVLAVAGVLAYFMMKAPYQPGMVRAADGPARRPLEHIGIQTIGGLVVGQLRLGLVLDRQQVVVVPGPGIHGVEHVHAHHAQVLHPEHLLAGVEVAGVVALVVAHHQRHARLLHLRGRCLGLRAVPSQGLLHK